MNTNICNTTEFDGVSSKECFEYKINEEKNGGLGLVHIQQF
uniref:Uncharacterized protein n=1 Tax=Rhizophora mucronata TaxID=61149 RepID=A0A2P2MX23_RHIMU